MNIAQASLEMRIRSQEHKKCGEMFVELDEEVLVCFQHC